jgi:hypothetical protein
MATSTLDQDSIDEGAKYFAFNFPNGTMGTTPVTPNIHISDTDASTVVVEASTTVPMTVMKVFGFNTLPASVTCSADQDYVNNDIMLVLDVTGSMNCRAGTGSSCPYELTEQPNARIARLRSAAGALYRALEGATGVRTRYGFMPYSMTVNVGRDLDSSWLANPGNYWQQVSVCTRTDSRGRCTRTSLQWQFNPATTHTSSWWTNTWEGCVEERSTRSQTGTSIKISSDVAQADIDDTGNTPALQWQAYDDDIDQGYTGTPDMLAHFCPAPAKRLATYATEADFNAALNASVSKVGGYTNHDIGIMWGTRYLSSTGMFSADNPTIFDEVPVDKHIVFLTDGAMTADDSNYSSFGIPVREERLTGVSTSTQRLQKHIDRFVNACDRARQMGITIWVIALDTGATSTISPCASGSDHFFVSDGSDLDQVFTRIGKGIGRLRMTQ